MRRLVDLDVVRAQGQAQRVDVEAGGFGQRLDDDLVVLVARRVDVEEMVEAGDVDLPGCGAGVLEQLQHGLEPGVLDQPLPAHARRLQRQAGERKDEIGRAHVLNTVHNWQHQFRPLVVKKKNTNNKQKSKQK